MNYYGEETRDEHTIAGRLIPICEAFHRSILKASGKPLPEQKYSIQLPFWCHNISDQLSKTIFRALIGAAPSPEKFSSRKYGQTVGMILRGMVFFLKDVPEQLKREGMLNLTKEQDDKLEKMSGFPLLLSVAGDYLKKPITNEGQLIEAGENLVQQKAEELIKGGITILRHLANQSVSEQHHFLFGISEGFISVLNDEGEFTGKRKRYETYILLLTNWPEIAEMQKAQPPKTRKDLLEWLEVQERKQIVEDPNTFYELCGDIDLDLAPPGHPQKGA